MFLYLSYCMDQQTPLYGGATGIKVEKDRSIPDGDTANTKTISLGSHSGTHIDFPNHFFEDGKTMESYDASFWIFEKPYMVNLPGVEDELLLFNETQLEKMPSDTDFLLIRTGFYQYRGEEKYWKHNPGIAAEAAAQLRKRMPKLRAIGMDIISITSYQNRPAGRESHKQFLRTSDPILLVEDMDLSLLINSPKKLMCFPLMIAKLDGAPVTVIAEL